MLLFQAAFPIAAGNFWDLVMRARALDNQVFVAGTSGARVDDSDNYVYWGRSLFVDPAGAVIQQAGDKEDIIYSLIGNYKVLIFTRNGF